MENEALDKNKSAKENENGGSKRQKMNVFRRTERNRRHTKEEKSHRNGNL